jgi:ABC-2 type transport system ATP-binding protein
VHQSKSPIAIVSDLSKSFDGKKVLNQVTFTVAPGHIVALIGANGAGKTSIMKALLGLIEIDNGSIQINSEKMTMHSHQSLRNVGAMIEYPSIYPFLTGRQQLLLFASGPKRLEQVQTIIEALGMTAYIDRAAKSYSLGMKQKLGIAQAMVNQPKLVILDEPMNGLDPQAIKLLRDFIDQQAQSGTSFLISSHILSELGKLADEFLILDKGNIIRTGTLKAITSNQVCSYQVETSDDLCAYKLLVAQQIPVIDTDPLTFEVSSPDVLTGAVLSIVKANLKLIEITRHEPDLEQIFLKTITTEEIRG